MPRVLAKQENCITTTSICAKISSVHSVCMKNWFALAVMLLYVSGTLRTLTRIVHVGFKKNCIVRTSRLRSCLNQRIEDSERVEEFKTEHKCHTWENAWVPTASAALQASHHTCCWSAETPAWLNSQSGLLFIFRHFALAGGPRQQGFTGNCEIVSCLSETHLFLQFSWSGAFRSSSSLCGFHECWRNGFRGNSRRFDSEESQGHAP